MNKEIKYKFEEEYKFLIEKGFSFESDNESVSFSNKENKILFCFDEHARELDCCFCKKENRITLNASINHFYSNSQGYYYACASNEILKEAISQCAGYIRKLIEDKNIFNDEVFKEVYDGIEEKRKKALENQQHELAVKKANELYAQGKYRQALSIYRSNEKYLKKSELMKMGICSKK